MATTGNPDPGQFGAAPGPAPYPTGQNFEPPMPANGFYPPPPPPYGAAPMYPTFPQNPSFSSAQYQPGMSQQMVYHHGIVQPVVVAPHYVPVKESYAGHIAFACIVFWLCGWLFGGIAFILAMVASNSSSDGHRKDAKRLGRASMTLSSVGLIIGLIAWSLVIWAIVVSSTTSYGYGSGSGSSGCSYYTCGGNCYKYRSYYYYTSSSCYYYYSSSCYSSSTGYCYYNY